MTDSTDAGAANTDTAATNAGDLPEVRSLLTDGDPGDNAGADDAAGSAAAADGKAGKADGGAGAGDDAGNDTPESYDLKIPDGATLAPEVVEEAKGLAKSLNLSQENAQKVANLLAKATTEAAKSADTGFAQRQADAVKGVVDGWVAELRGDKEIGGDKLTENLAAAREAMEATTTPQMRVLLQRSGLGNNVHVIKHFLQIAPAFRQSRHVSPGDQPGVKRSAAEVLYGTTN